MDMAEKLSNMINIAIVQEMQDGFADSSDMALVTVDTDGTPITRRSNFNEFYVRYMQNERYDTAVSRSVGRTSVYTNALGLLEFCVPIKVNNEIVGYFIGGEVLAENYDMAGMQRIVKELRVSENEFFTAAAKVPVVHRDRVQAAARFLSRMGEHIIGKIANVNMTGLDTDAVGRMKAISDKNMELSKQLETKLTQLSGITRSCAQEVKAASETVKVIQDIALRTRILGFNASIEASRVKESGKGFGVIAQEVRTLADTSKSSADKIGAGIKVIGGFAGQISEETKDAEHLVQMNRENINQFRRLADEISGKG